VKRLGQLTSADLGRSGHVTVKSVREGIKATATYLDTLDCIHHDTGGADGLLKTYLSDTSGVVVIASPDSTWEVEL